MNIIEEYIEIFHDHFKIVNWLRKFDGLNNMAFSCGITVNMGIGTYICCDGTWRPCINPSRGCACPAYTNDVDNTSVLTPDYSFTTSAHLYTQYVTTAKLFDQTYYAGPIKHSSWLTIGDLVIWPGFDVNSNTTNVVMAVDHCDVTDDNKNCCGSISVGFPPSCQVKFCCGDGCCC